MKKFLSLKRVSALLLFVFAAVFASVLNFNSASADNLCGLSQITVSSLENGMTVTFKDPPLNIDDHSVYAGTIHSVMDGNSVPVYCVDLHRNVGLGDNTYTDTCAYVLDKIQWIFNHYFPYAVYPMVDVNAEAAAIQIAIWHYTDAVDANTVSDVGIRNRALAIIADADLNGIGAMPIVTFFILPGMGSEFFYIKTLDQNGDPVQVNNICLYLSDTNGILSEDTVSTNSSGISPEVEVSGGITGGTVTAIARMLFPQGRIIHAQTGDRQSLAIAYPVYGKMGIVIDWGALPIELSLFTSIVTESNVTLNWTTTTEVNNSGFEIERSVIGNDWMTISSVKGQGTTTSPQQYSYTDRGLSTGIYNYRLKQIDFNGNFEYFSLQNEVVIGTPTTFKLQQNYPNPFNPETKISYTIPVKGLVTLKVFDIMGKEVATLVNEQQTAGYYTVNFNASVLSSGVYFYRIQSENLMQVKKMTLIK